MSWVYHFLFFVLFFICSWLYHCVRNYSVFFNVRRVSAIWGNFYWFLCFGITKRQKNNLTIFILTRDWQCLMWLDGCLWRVDFVRKISSSLRDSSRRKDIFVVILLFLSYLLCIGTQRGVVEEKSDWLSWHCFFCLILVASSWIRAFCHNGRRRVTVQSSFMAHCATAKKLSFFPCTVCTWWKQTKQNCLYVCYFLLYRNNDKSRTLLTFFVANDYIGLVVFFC